MLITGSAECSTPAPNLPGLPIELSPLTEPTAVVGLGWVFARTTGQKMIQAGERGLNKREACYPLPKQRSRQKGLRGHIGLLVACGFSQERYHFRGAEGPFDQPYRASGG